MSKVSNIQYMDIWFLYVSNTNSPTDCRHYDIGVRKDNCVSPDLRGRPPSHGQHRPACLCVGHYTRGAACYATRTTCQRGNLSAPAWRWHKERPLYP